MENQAPEKKKNVFLISGLVFLVLFVLPLGSIYFLNSGLQYRKTSVSELSDLGKVGDFNLNNQNNLPVSPAMLRGRVAVVNFFSENDSIAELPRFTKIIMTLKMSFSYRLSILILR